MDVVILVFIVSTLTLNSLFISINFTSTAITNYICDKKLFLKSTNKLRFDQDQLMSSRAI